MLKVNGSILIIEKMWKKIINSFQYKCGVKNITCVIINYGMCKMQLLNNGFNMLKVDGSTFLMYHVNS
jgi:hypothetical protein